MKRFLATLMILGVAAVPAAAGPNVGGVLIVHDTGLAFSTVEDLPIPPPTTPPASCWTTDNNAPLGTPDLQTVWKVYASFPDGSSPRVKGLAWGIFDTGANYVTTAGLPDPPNCFQVVMGSWPSPPGSIGQSFVYVQTAQIVECYWFGGYSYGGIFATGPHATQSSDFVDDAVPGNTDPIVGFSTLGFGQPGQTICGCCPPGTGACCHPDGTCEVVFPDACLPPNSFVGGDCLPGLCPSSEAGACCLSPADCQYVTEAECAALNGDYQGAGIPCTPQLCLPNPTEVESWSRIKAAYR